MFTGIIRHVGTILAGRDTSSGRRFTIDLGPLAGGLGLGDSIAVNGACLTAAALGGSCGADFDVIAETLARTTLGGLAPGAKVNLEPALRLGQGLDGHLVQGHVDGIARLKAIKRGGQVVLQFTAGRELTDLMVPKGSVAINGVSLTLVDATADGFSVAIIPTTLAQTTLGLLSPGAAVNIETDIIGRYIRKFVAGGASAQPAGLTMQKLKDSGFA